MKTRVHIKTLVMMVAALMVFGVTKTVSAQRTLTSGGAVTSNKSDQDYSTWASNITSYLYENSNGTLTRVEAMDKTIVIEEYSKSFKLKSSTSIPRELNIFGGFYAGTDANYIVFGQSNYSEKSNLEVFRVVKYSKEWKRLGACSLKNCNTVVPFEAGSLRFAECKDMLYIRTCHKMYTTSDGLNHQANLTMSVDTRNMKVTDSYSGISNIGYGYVSHSFNQFIQVDGNELLAVDHGDAYPRSVVLIKYDKAAGEQTFTGGCESVDLLEFPGAIGANYTGGSVGGFEVSNDSYLVVGNYMKKGKAVRNVFVSVTSKEKFDEDHTKLTYLTNYKTNVTASTPQLVKIDDEKFMVLWETINEKTWQSNVSYVLIDQNGKKLSEVQTVKGHLSDCQPIVYNKQIVWYFTSESTPIFCAIPLDGSKAEDGPIAGDIITIGKMEYKISKCTSNTKTATLVEVADEKSKTIKVPDTIKVQGISFQVTEITDYALERCSACTNVTFGKNIKKMGNNIFSYWNHIKTITIKSEVLTSVEKYAFEGVSNAKIKVSKNKLTKYKKLFKNKGLGDKTSIVAYN